MPSHPDRVRRNYEEEPAQRISMETIAHVMHEANRALCAALGDNSQPSWVDAPEWQIESALNAVFFHRGNPDAGPWATHDAWVRDKTASGWTYGPVKDADKKTHPCLVSFGELPPEQQAKDVLARAIVHALLIYTT
jgi:hypothetical protein